ncbi:MAG: hypothetical protein ACI9J0_003493 [Cryomorphaceae bacterium]|jgi:hypothetical protein
MPARGKSSCTWREHRCNDTIYFRQSILRRKLAPQNHDDRPASVLLDTIQVESS